MIRQLGATRSARRDPAPSRSSDELSGDPSRDGVEFLFAMFVDMHGKPCAKLVPVSAIDGLLADGAGFAGFAAGADGPDAVVARHPGHARPQLVHAGARGSPGSASSSATPTCEGEPWPFAPRVILRRQIERLAEAGLCSRSGAEAEYFLVRRTPEGGIDVADPLDRQGIPATTPGP